MLLKSFPPIHHSASAEACEWSYGRISCFYGQAWETEFLKIADYEMSSSQTIRSTDES